MTNKVNVSIIIPSYNIIPYMKQCLDSVINQTLKDIEIICVDAHSTDGTLEVIQEYAQRDSRIQVVLSDKKSYGYQMNMGLRIAKGKYIGIIESDDWADSRMFEELFIEAEKRSVQIIKTNYYKYSTVDGEKNELCEILRNLPYNVVFETESDRRILMRAPSIWAGLYKRDFLEQNNICFLESPGASYQDTGFIIKCLVCATKVLLLDKAYVHYRIDHAGSSVKSDSKIYCVCDEFSEVWKFLEERPELLSIYREDILAVQCERYCWNFYHIAINARKEFLQRMYDDFKEAQQEDDLKEALYSSHNWKFLQMVLKHPKKAENYFYKDPMISVIMLRRREDTFGECLRSIQNQTLKGMEFIQAVTDQRTDIRMLKEAVMKANGKYLLFVDRDMVYDPQMLEIGCRQAFAKEAELVVLDGELEYVHSNRIEEKFFYLANLSFAKNEKVFSAENAMNDILSFTLPYLGNRIYQKDYLKRYMDKKGGLFEHGWCGFRYLSLYYASRVTCISERMFKDLLSEASGSAIIGELTVFFRWAEQFHSYLEKQGNISKLERSFCKSVIRMIAPVISGISCDAERMRVFRFLYQNQFLQKKVLGHCTEFYGDTAVWALRLLGISGVLTMREFLQRLKSPEYKVIKKAKTLSGKPKVSVIIPVYNSHKYLDACLDSVIRQNLKEIEIVCIDDGSTDGSLNLLKQYIDEEPRMTLLCQQNYKPSVARNAGIQLAEGEYLFFMDSDDLLKEDALSVLYQEASEKELDVLCFNAEVFANRSDIELTEMCIDYENFYDRKGDYEGVTSGSVLFEKMYRNREYLASPCLQFTNRSYFIGHGLWFEPGIYHEDEIFGYKNMLYAKRAAYTKGKLYIRRIRKDSIMSSAKGFDHIYGKFVCYEKILKLVSGQAADDHMRYYGMQLAEQMLLQARSYWGVINEAERFVFWGLPDGIREKFVQLILIWNEMRDRTTLLSEWNQKEQKERSRLRNELTILQINYQKQKKRLVSTQEWHQKEHEERMRLKRECEKAWNAVRQKEQEKTMLQQEVFRLKNKIDHVFDEYLRGMLCLAHATGKKTAIWGCGKIGMEILQKMSKEQIRADFLIDQDPLKKHQVIFDYTVYTFDEVKDQVDIIFATSHKYFHSIQAMAQGKAVIELIR